MELNERHLPSHFKHLVALNYFKNCLHLLHRNNSKKVVYLIFTYFDRYM